jgi:hypothetical protein
MLAKKNTKENQYVKKKQVIYEIKASIIIGIAFNLTHDINKKYGVRCR